MLAGHLRQALDLGIGPSPPMAESMYASKGLPLPSQPGLRRPNVDSLAAEALDQVEAAEALGDSDPPVAQSGKSSGSGYADVEKANMRTAMLSLSADICAGGLAPECKAGWMRSAMLPLAPSPGAPEPLAAPAAQPTCGTQDSTTMTRPLIESLDKEDVEHLRRLRQFSDSDLRQLRAGEVAGKTARERAFIRSAMLPLSTGNGNGEVEGCFPVFVHIYDVTQEVGIRRLNKVLANKRLPVKFGGVFHAGVEVNGEEWSYGATETEEEPGVNQNKPKMHPDHHYRQTVVMPCTHLSAMQIEEMTKQLSQEYPGPAYDLLRRNCCHFADDFCQRLGVGRIPSWVYRLARIAARIENFLQAAQRIRTPC